MKFLSTYHSNKDNLISFIKTSFTCSMILFFVIFLFGCNQNSDTGYNKNNTEGTCEVYKVTALISFIESGMMQGVRCDTCHTSHHAQFGNFLTGTHKDSYESNPDECRRCHGEDLNTDAPQVDWISCNVCHHGEEGSGNWTDNHGGLVDDVSDCNACHEVGDSGDSCNACHHGQWNGFQGTAHSSLDAVEYSKCTECHEDGGSGDLCNDCHHGQWGGFQGTAHSSLDEGEYPKCSQCHEDGGSGDSCNSCHHSQWDGFQDTAHSSLNAVEYSKCTQCHEDGGSSDSCNSCHHSQWGGFQGTAHSSVAEGEYPTCAQCHEDDGSGAFCNDCHHGQWGGFQGTAHSSLAEGEYPKCSQCHEDDGSGAFCNDCHHSQWGGFQGTTHPDAYNANPDGCTCHGESLGSCADCHHQDGNDASCTECHTSIDWTTTGGESGGDKHGANIATGANHFLLSPYDGWTESSGFNLLCTDCHDIENAPNVMLIAGVVNGNSVEIGSIGDPSDLKNLCYACHESNAFIFHHEFSNPTAPYCEIADGDSCTQLCHYEEAGAFSMTCSNCHFHGADDSWLLTAPGGAPGAEEYSGRRSF